MAETIPPPTDTDYPDYAEVTPIKPARNGTTHTNGATVVGRVPPHDLAAEASLLGAMLLKTEAIEAGARLERAAFFKPAHAHIHAAICDLHERDEPADVVTVADELTRDGLLDAVGGKEYLKELQALTPATSNAARYARIVDDFHLLRGLINTSGEIADIAYSMPDDVDAAVARAIELVLATGRPPIIEESLMTDLQNADADPVIPGVMPRDDHTTCLFYAPGINWLSGEPGEGKTLIALWAVQHEARHDRPVLYLDFEGTAQGTRARLAEMGVTDFANVHYVRRHDKWDVASLAELRQMVADNQYRLVVIDAVAGAMEAEGLDPESNKDVEKWVALVPMICFAAGAAVVCIDHVTKNKETRGRWMIGAQRKMARADAAFMLEMHTKAGVGTAGYGRLVVGKDRYGALAAHMTGSTICEVAIVSEVDPDNETATELFVRLAPPQGKAAGGAIGRTWYMEQVSRALETNGALGKAKLRSLIGRQAKYVDQAIVMLEAQHFIREIEAKGKARPYESVVPYRQPLEPPPGAAPAADTRYEKADDDNDEPF